MGHLAPGSIVKISTKSLTFIIALICIFQANVCSSAARTLGAHSESHATFSQQDARLGFLSEQQTEYSVKPQPFDSLKLKSPNLALTYAVIPGFIVHGAGHFYAGRRTTGIVLLACEVVGCTFFTVGALDQAVSHLEDAHPSDGASGEGLIVIGTILFVGSWTYDMIGAPLAVQKYNQALLDKEAVGLKFRLQKKEPGVYLVWRF